MNLYRQLRYEIHKDYRGYRTDGEDVASIATAVLFDNKSWTQLPSPQYWEDMEIDRDNKYLRMNVW